MTRTRYVCPTCQQAVTVAVAVREAPRCAHVGTPQDARRAAAMAPESVAPRRETDRSNEDAPAPCDRPGA